MDYPYPPEFPQKSRNLILAERIRAARDFETAKRKARYLSEIEGLLRNYILRVFIIFVREAGELGRQGVWSAGRMESESREFLRWFTSTGRYEKGYDNSGHRLREMLSQWGGILDDVQREFEQSPEWKEYENILLELADTQATRLDERISEQGTLLSTKVGWEDIEISLISDERVQVKVGSQVQTCNYTEMGFEDKRSGKPKEAWGVLRTLARTGGVIPNSARDSKEFLRMGKRLERMRRTLRDHFGISSDPIPLDPARGYCCRFRITRAPSFEK